MAVSHEEDWDVPMEGGRVAGLAKGEGDPTGSGLPVIKVTNDDQVCVDDRAIFPSLSMDIRGSST